MRIRVRDWRIKRHNKIEGFIQIEVSYLLVRNVLTEHLDSKPRETSRGLTKAVIISANSVRLSGNRLLVAIFFAHRISVRLELQADFYAGVWGHYENSMFGSLDEGDLKEAIDCASVIGDDYLQKKSQGYAVEESFTHGTAAQRMRWLKKGLTTGDISQGDTFSVSDRNL